MRIRMKPTSSAMVGLLVGALVALSPSPVLAVVQITFYSHEGNSLYFPHAFVTLRGIEGRTGRPVDLSYGFTTPHAGLHVLSGPVTGVLELVQPDYIADSTAHFSMPLSGAQVASVIAVAERWRRLPQPSYELWSQNCVVFVAQIAARLGLAADLPSELVTKPSGFMDHLTRHNRQGLSARRARLHRTAEGT
jgi:hypothetical protein